VEVVLDLEDVIPCTSMSSTARAPQPHPTPASSLQLQLHIGPLSASEVQIQLDFAAAPKAAGAGHSDMLRQLWLEGVMEERALDATLEKEMQEQAERARKFIETQLLESDFSWMRESRRQSGKRNPRTTRTSCFYDLSCGTVGSQKGSPLWMEGRGRWMHVRQGSAKLPCVKLYENAFFVLRVPFRKSGGGNFCNTFTVSMMMRVSHVSARGVMSSGGWDQWNQLGDGDEPAQIVMNDRGAIGSHNSFSLDGGSGSQVASGQWCAVSFAVDTIYGTVRTFVNGQESAVVRSPKICKDGQHALKGRLALFYSRADRPSGDRMYIRQITIHNVALELAQVAKEHEMLHELLIEDALATVPSYLQRALSSEHSVLPFKEVKAVRMRVRAIQSSAATKAYDLWRALLLPAPIEEIDKLHNAMKPHDVAEAARWVWLESSIEESTAPSGETLLHCAAYAGCEVLVAALLKAGARPSARGLVSGCTPLHAAAARGHVSICEQLLAAGAYTSTASTSGKRSALDLACLAGQATVARLLVESGGADPYMSVAGGETAMALLRRLGSPEALELLSELDALCSSRVQAKAGAEVEPERCSERDEAGATDSEDDEGAPDDREDDNDDELVDDGEE